MDLDPTQLHPNKLYLHLVRTIMPRPIAWVSTVSPTGVLNLAPYSFFNAFNYVPPVIGFSSIGRKDSLNNIEATGEFVWNLVTRELAEGMNQT
ncbi:MAG: flavin reductase family protein, partial [Planctomyces sp.]